MSGDELVLRLDPAFVQCWEFGIDGVQGTGRWQRAVIRVSGASLTAPLPKGPTLLQGGWLRAGGERFHEVIPVPLAAEGPIDGFLAQEDDFPKAIGFAGTAVTIELDGVPEGAEPLPVEWAPI